MALFNTNVPELSGSDTAVCLDNLELLGLRQSRVTESILAELSELADAVIHDAGGDPDTVDSILLSLQTEPPENPFDPSESVIASAAALANRESVLRLSLLAEVQLRLILYRFVADRMSPGSGARKGSAAATDASRGRIAYMAGAFADKAYAKLSPLVPHARAATFHSFVDACEEVHGGLCEYGILPLENTQSGKLTAFSRLILRYDLCVVAVCDLENGALPGQFTRFALLRKSPDEAIPLLPAAQFVTEDIPHCIELLHTAASPSLTELLSAAAFCGLTPARVDTLPRFEELDFLWEDTARGPVPPICCVFSMEKASTGLCDASTFARFLALEAPEDTIMGVYGIIS